MGVQTIKGILTDGSAPLANVVVEVQFSYGASQVTGPGVVAKTDDDGSFSVDVFNNADGVDTVALTVAEKIIATFDFDPEEAEVDIGTVIMETDIGGRPRLISAAAAAVPQEPKSATTIIAPSDKTYLLQSDMEVTGLDPGYSDAEGRYTYRSEHGGKHLFILDSVPGNTPADGSCFLWHSANSTWRFWLGGTGGTLIWSSADGVNFPWEIVNWDQEGPQAGVPVCTEEPEAKEITVASLAAAIDAILNP